MKVVLTVDSKVSLNYTRLRKKSKACAEKLKETFTHNNPVYAKNARMGISNNVLNKKTGEYVVREPEEYKTFSIVNKNSKRTIKISRGGIKKVKKILKQYGFEPKIKDRRTASDRVFYNSKIKARKDQKPALELIKKKHQGIIVGPCSYGKTIVGLEALMESEQVGIVCVWNKDHQKQWIQEAIIVANINPKNIGGIGGIFASKKKWETAREQILNDPDNPVDIGDYPGNGKVKKVNICMQQSLWNIDNREKFFAKAGFFIADELQKFAANTFLVVADEFPGKYKIGVTADVKRKDKKQFLIYDCFGDVIYRAEDKDIESRKKSRITLVESDYENDDYDDGDCGFPKLLNDIARNVKRNKLIILRTLRKTNRKKLVLILVERRWQALYLRSVLKKKHGLRVRLLVGQIPKKEIEEVEDWKPSWKKFMLKYDDDKEFFKIKKLAKQKKLDVTVTTQKGFVGLNVKTFDHGIMTTPRGDNIELMNQIKGRIERNYDDELKEIYGEKSTPTFDYILDTKSSKLKKKGTTLINSFANVNVKPLKRKV